jgi:hypothetical protein
MKKTLMYCPLLDGRIVDSIQKFSVEVLENLLRFQERITDYLPIKLRGITPLQMSISEPPFIDIENNKELHFDSIVVDKERENKLNEFWQKHNMLINKPEILPPTSREINFVAAAIMWLQSSWDKKHLAKKFDYEVLENYSCLGQTINVKGFSLSNVNIALQGIDEVSAEVDLGNNIFVEFTDISAFGVDSFEDEFSLYIKVLQNKFDYSVEGQLISPCINEEVNVKNHLKDMYWNSYDSLYRLKIVASEALTKLKLDEKGVEVRAEVSASASMVFTCAVNNDRKYCLQISNGLVVNIRYKKQPIFVAYIPQEKFQRNIDAYEAELLRLIGDGVVVTHPIETQNSKQDFPTNSIQSPEEGGIFPSEQDDVIGSY